MADDSEKLRKQIAVLSNLIQTHKQVKQESQVRPKVVAERFSWAKIRSNKETTNPEKQRKQTQNVTSSFLSTTSASKCSSKAKPGACSSSRKDAIGGNLNLAFNSNGNRIIVAGHSKPSSSKSNISPELPMSKLNTVSKSFLTKSPTRWVRKSDISQEEKSHSDSEIYKGTKNTKGKINLQINLAQSKAVSTSMSTLSARLSELSSTLALASAKLQPSSKPVLSHRSFKDSMPSTSTQMPRQAEAMTSKKLHGTRPQNTRSYSWTKSGSSQIAPVNVNSTADLKWAKPGISSGQSPTTNKRTVFLSGPSRSVTGEQTWSRKKKNMTTSQSKHVWRSKNLLKLDNTKSSSFGISQSTPRRRSSEKKSLNRKSIVSRYRVVHTKRKTPIKAEKSNKVVVIGGVMYKSSSNRLQKAASTTSPQSTKTTSRTNQGSPPLVTLSIRGEKFTMDSNGKTLRRINKEKPNAMASSSETPNTNQSSASPKLVGKRRSSMKRISIGGAVFTETLPGVLIRTAQQSTRLSASRKSVNNARQYKYKKMTATARAEQYCMYYSRFGKCNKGDKCKYIHDPSKVAVCTKFLKGKCKNTDGTCTFSHRIDKEKMPVCQFFLKGTCFNDDCPYSHVNVSNKAAICEDFVKGYCPLGQQCKKKHSLECEEFTFTGKCSKGHKCKQMHRKKRPKKRKSTDQHSNQPIAKKKAMEETVDEGFLPLEQPYDSVPEESSAADVPDSESRQSTPQTVQIRPRFLQKQDTAG